MIVKEYKHQHRNYPDVSILRNNLNAIREMKADTEKNLNFTKKYFNDPKVESQYKRDIRSYNESERMLEKKIKNAERELNSNNFLCPEGYIWVEKHYTKKGTVNGHCRKVTMRR